MDGFCTNLQVLRATRLSIYFFIAGEKEGRDFLLSQGGKMSVSIISDSICSEEVFWWMTVQYEAFYSID